MFTRVSKQKRILYAFLLITAGGCDCNDDDRPPDQVNTRVKPGVDFSEYHTFRIQDELSKDDIEDAGVDIDIDPEDIPDDVRLNIDVATDQARQELEELGLTEVGEDEDADLVVFSLGATNDEDAIYWECVPGYWWGYWGWVWDTCAWLEPIYVEYTVGTVALGLADPDMEDVVFGGVVQGVADGEDDVEDRIRNGVHVMFEEYPEGPSH
jgi:hypothetical protein